jgi:predicted small lipoprotein YifL
MSKYLMLSLLLSVMALNACGTRGSLYLPPQQKTPPPAAASTADPGTSEPAGS